MDELMRSVRHIWMILVEVRRKYNEDRGALIAAAISFFALLSIVPLALLGVWGLGQFLSSSEAFQYVMDYLEDYLAGSTDPIRGYLKDLVHRRGTIGWLGVAGLVWAGSQGFVILEMAMNVALRVPQRRGFLESRLLGLGMIVLVGGLLALSLLITSTVTAVGRYPLPVVGRPSEIPLLWSAVGVVVPVLLTILSFTVVYGIVPNIPIPWRTAAIAGATAGLLWEVAKRLYTSYLLAHGAAYDQLYGPIGSIIGLVIWIYYSSVILVLGAELASVLQHVHPRGRRQ